MIDMKNPHKQQAVDVCVGEIKLVLRGLRKQLGKDFHGTLSAPLTIINPGSEPVHWDIKE